MENDETKDVILTPTIDYWLKKVFPFEEVNIGTESSPRIIKKWLTKWCYEICMDWSHYSAIGRVTDKVYEESYISSWGISAGSED